MHIVREKLNLLLLMLGVWIVVLTAAMPFSRWQWYYYQGMNWFHFWWSGICLFVLSTMTIYLIWRKAGKISYGQWLWYIVPLVISFFLVWRVGFVARGFAAGSRAGLLMAYASYSWGYTAVILLGVVGFPYEEIFGPHSRRHRLVWKVILCSTAALISWVAMAHSIQLVYSNNATFDFSAIEALQLWMQKITVAVFIFLFARVLVPTTVTAAVGTFGNQDPPKPQVA